MYHDIQDWKQTARKKEKRKMYAYKVYKKKLITVFKQ